jgi:hypothetical protein
MSEPTNHNTGSQGNQGQQGNVAGANYGVQNTYYNSGGRQLSKQEYRSRQSLLTQMRTEVESRLTQSIHRAAFVNLGKEQQPQQVQRPWDMSVKVGEQRSVQLPPQTTILDVFDNPTISGKFLILGKPGGGKTTTLLELAEALIERAEGDSDAPIPVILELSTWQEVTKPKFLPFGEREKYDPSIKEWVLSQLMSKGVSQDIGEKWLREKELVLLLDGLDELQPERQAKCVRAINQFFSSEFSPSHLVVCSRKEEYEDYEDYEEILLLNGAICLEDLTNEQIRDYFASINLGEFWESIKGSEKIIDFIRQPLFLAITSIAYQQIDVEEWRNCNTEERAIDYLLGVYRVERLTKKTSSNSQNKTSDLNPLSVQNRLARIAKYFYLQPFISVEEIKIDSLGQQNHKILQYSLALLIPTTTCFIFLLNPFTLPLVFILISVLTILTILFGMLIILVSLVGEEIGNFLERFYCFITGIFTIVLSYFILNLSKVLPEYFVTIAYTLILSLAIILPFHLKLRCQNIKKVSISIGKFFTIQTLVI